MNLRYHELARKEIVEITRYYADERPELGKEFYAELNSAVEVIKSDPLRFEQVRAGIRRCLLDRFPYGVYYRKLDVDGPNCRC